MKALLNPGRYGVFSLQLVMHKLLRFVTPAFLIAGFLSLSALFILGRYQALFLLTVSGLALVFAVGGCGLKGGSRIVERVGNLAYYYLMVNYALVLAWINVARGNRMVLWSPERKSS